MAKDTKRCTRCKVTRPHKDFSRDGSRSDGLQARCIVCQAEVQRLRQEAGKRAIQSATYYATPEGRAKRRTANRRHKIRRIFRISLEEYEAALCSATHCEICGKEFGRARGRNLDHDHLTGRVRGVLCGPCNRGIGLLGDTEAGIYRAVSYLRRYL